MSIASEITRINTNIANSYTAVDNKNGTLPQVQNSANLASAIDSIEVIEQATAEGESLSLTNTKAMPYKDYKVKGKSEQATRSGKNKCNIINKNISISGASYISNNGEILINGECTLNSSNKAGILKLKANVQYTYSANNNGNFNNSYFVINNNGSYIYFGPGSKTFTVSQDGDYSFDFILVAGNYNNITIKPQVEENTTSTEWEQYGASPSPEYPSEIHSVADDVNLLPYPYSISTYNQNGLKVTFNNDGTMTLNGTTNNVCYVNVIGTGDEKTLKAGTYTLKGFVNGLTRFRLFDVTNTRGFDDTGNGNTFTITEDISYRVYFEIPSNVTFNNAILKPKLQKGTTATPYSSYNQGTVTIKQRGTTESNDYTFQTAPLRSLPNGVKDTIEEEQHRKIGRQTGTLTETTTITLSDAKTNGAYMCNIKPSGTLTGKTIELEAGDYEILYELEEETIELLTQNQATTMLDIIKTGSYEGTTNIYTDEDVKPTIGVGYYKKG